jgi:hypothetical protein
MNKGNAGLGALWLVGAYLAGLELEAVKRR